MVWAVMAINAIKHFRAHAEVPAACQIDTRLHEPRRCGVPSVCGKIFTSDDSPASCTAR